MTLENIRKEIDLIDDQIITLLETRMTLVEKVITAKSKENIRVLDPQREKFILKRVEQKIENPRYRSSIQSVYTEIMKHSRDYQEKNRFK